MNEERERERDYFYMRSHCAQVKAVNIQHFRSFSSLHNFSVSKHETRRRRRRQWLGRIQNVSPPQENEGCARRKRSRSNFTDPTCRDQSSNFHSRSFHKLVARETDEDKTPEFVLNLDDMPKFSAFCSQTTLNVACRRLSL